MQLLAPSIIPAMKRLPDKRLARNADQQWANSVPIPLDPSILGNQLPLPKPTPDLAFGYSQAAFTRNPARNNRAPLLTTNSGEALLYQTRNSDSRFFALNSNRRPRVALTTLQQIKLPVPEPLL